MSQTVATLIPKKGLFVNTDGIIWSFGSEVSFFTPDRHHHHYYFTWWEQDIDDSVLDDKTVLILGSYNTAVFGNYSLKNISNTQIETEINCQYLGENSALADITYIKIWMPFLENGAINNLQLSWDLSVSDTTQNFSKFYDKELILTTKFGKFKISSSHPFYIKRNDSPFPNETEHDKRSQFLELYESNINVAHGEYLRRQFTIEQIDDKKSQKTTHASSKKYTDIVMDGHESFDYKEQNILPKPLHYEIQNTHYIIPKTSQHKSFKTVKKFREILSQQWQIGTEYYPKITSTKVKSLDAEAYQITVTHDGVLIKYNDNIGLQHALYTLAQMTSSKDSQLTIPRGILKDQPKTSWRGIHMFTGPTSLDLHRRMFERVLMPLKVNKAVIQCEQAEWESQPTMRDGINISLADLESKFNFLRNNNIEPIPLIQSLGHMK